jgi:hypothetical protein
LQEEVPLGEAGLKLGEIGVLGEAALQLGVLRGLREAALKLRVVRGLLGEPPLELREVGCLAGERLLCEEAQVCRLSEGLGHRLRGQVCAPSPPTPVLGPAPCRQGVAFFVCPSLVWQWQDIQWCDQNLGAVRRAVKASGWDDKFAHRLPLPPFSALLPAGMELHSLRVLLWCGCGKVFSGVIKIWGLGEGL